MSHQPGIDINIAIGMSVQSGISIGIGETLRTMQDYTGLGLFKTIQDYTGLYSAIQDYTRLNTKQGYTRL